MKHAIQILCYGKLNMEPRSPIPEITKSEVAEAQQFFPLQKFFIFGHARSGTTLLARLIRQHPDVHCNYQGHFFTKQPTLEGLVNRPDVEQWIAHRSFRWNRGHDPSPVMLRAVCDFMMEREARQLGVKVVGDKSPNSLLNGKSVRLAHKLYPDGKIIFIVRDGRDAAVSHRFQAFIDATQHLDGQDLAIRDGLATDPDPFLRGERSIFTEKGIRNAAISWLKNVSETNQLGKDFYGDQYIALRYEDLLKQPWEQMTRLWTFIGVDTEIPDLSKKLHMELNSNPDRDWQEHKAGDLISPLEKGKSGSWRGFFTERDRKIFQDIAGDQLQDWGYHW